MQLKVRDIVSCNRIGKGSFKIIDIRGSGKYQELRLENVETKEIVEWVYAAHVHLDRKNLRDTMASRNDEVMKILNKKKRK